MHITICSYIIPWRMYEASPLVNGHRVHGDGFVVLSHPYEWPEEKTQLAEEAEIYS